LRVVGCDTWLPNVDGGAGVCSRSDKTVLLSATATASLHSSGLVLDTLRSVADNPNPLLLSSFSVSDVVSYNMHPSHFSCDVTKVLPNLCSFLDNLHKTIHFGTNV